jgi:ABC-type transport system involved in cytochrome c biogenesis permease subunit
MVLLHLGVLGLMTNELYVNYTNNEQRMTFYEGETSSQAIDIRYVELAVVDQSDAEMDQIVVIPVSKLRSGERISSEHLPFELKTIEFFENSDIRVVKDPSVNRATRGVGLKVEVEHSAPTSGVESRRRNFASAYIELFEKDSDTSLGVYLVSQYLDLPEAQRAFQIRGRDRVEFAGRSYLLDLRFKTEYKPYSITLLDTTAEYYLGTQTPRHFSSDIVFYDRVNGMTFEKKIWMNNPMRYAGETFYQTNYEKDRSGREISTLQVVTNQGWMIPYVCCMFTVVGLLIQFGSSLLSFLEKRSKPAVVAGNKKIPITALGHVPVGVGASPNPDLQLVDRRNFNDWLPAALIAGLFGAYLLGQAYTAYSGKIVKNEMRLDLLGQIPVTKNGRVQPLDSVARHAVLQMSKREYVNDAKEKSQPAIRWLADTMFGVEDYDQYRLFRIEDTEMAAALNLPFPMPTKERYQKSNLKYTLAEVVENRAKIREMLTGDPEHRTPLQKKIARLGSLLNQALSLELTLGNPRAARLSFLQRLELADMNAENDSIPLIVPNSDPQRPWISFVSLEDQIWLKEQCQKFNAWTTQELAEAVIQKVLLPIQREELIKARVIEKIVNSPDLVALLSKEMGEVSKPQLRQLLENRWNQIPPERTEALREIEGPFVDELLKEQMPRLIPVLEQQIAKLNQGSGFVESNISPLAQKLSQLRPAYLTGDADTFNRVLTEYLAEVNTNPPDGLKPYSVATEFWYNRFAPFYWATVIYVAVMLVAMLSWIDWTGSLHRAAGWLLWLGVIVHLVGLVARVVISGRPPVTNLYSSFLFVADVFVIGMLILERITKMQIGYFLAGLGGFLALLGAWNLTISDGDTFSVLVAVLDTQFWLATHVVTITIGYGATMIAGFLGMAYVIKGLCTSSLDRQSRREFGNMIYGTVCFGLITSFFGTVLGGLWGDDSWGRFWGWDPKENGALMIVLWNAVILHARWGGIVKERGMALLAILGNLITLWSWKGVNVLGVGLHAYAGTEGKTLIYMILLFGLVGLLIVGIGLIPTKAWKSYAKELAQQ